MAEGALRDGGRSTSLAAVSRSRGLVVAFATLLVATVALVGAPLGHADAGPSTQPSSAAVADARDGAPDGVTSADDRGQTADSPGNSENAPGHAADGPGNSENAPGHAADGPGNSENAPGRAADQGASIGQSADSTASAGQDDVANTHVTVRVDEPGNGTPIVQENRAEADAAALASADSSRPATGDQVARSDAQAGQAHVANTAVTVRVESPGDDAPVTQTNTAGATASATTASSPTFAGESDETAVATATQQGAANTSVSVRVFSPGNDGEVVQRNEAVAVAQADDHGGGRAVAAQDGVRNTSVSIRVESPGAADGVTQESEAVASVTGATAGEDGIGVAVATTEDGLDTTVAVAVDGDKLESPLRGLEVWEWTWTWQRDETESLAAFAGMQPGSWGWNWGALDANGERPGEVRSRSARDDEGAGASWSWSWSWTRDGVADWAWQWSWDSTPACSCIWVWTWSWSWTGQPAENASSASPGDAARAADAAAGQSNIAIAHAEAATAVDVAQVVAQNGTGAGAQYAGQLVTVDQAAEAVATAHQSDVTSLTRGIAPQAQSNSVVADAVASLAANVLQDADQALVTHDRGVADQWSGQDVELGQLGSAAANATQRRALLTGAGAHDSTGAASAEAALDVEQVVAQDALVDGGALSQVAAQLALVEQTVDAASMVVQNGGPRSRPIGGWAAAGTLAGGVALVGQAAHQAAVRGDGAASQSTAQLVYVGQDASAHATTVQQAGAASLPGASSDAAALDRAAVVQEASQTSLGASALDAQILVQQSIVAQSAKAVSWSNGGIAGSATVSNCVVVQQGAAQGLGASAASASGGDLTVFCLPPAPSAMSTDPVGDGGTEPATLAERTAAPAQTPAFDDEPQLFRGGHPVAGVDGPTATTSRRPVRTAPGAPQPGQTDAGLPVATKISVLPSPQARLDTRPESHAGAGDAGREPSLPPAGDPPPWVSALADAAAGGTGSTGVAAILLAFVLVPPLLLRAREGSVVRRPIGVLAPIDVPV